MMRRALAAAAATGGDARETNFMTTCNSGAQKFFDLVTQRDSSETVFFVFFCYYFVTPKKNCVVAD